MSADTIVYLRDVVDPLPECDTTEQVIRRGGGDVFVVKTSLSRATRRGYQIITHERTGEMVLARGCAASDDPRIVDAAIEAWRAGWHKGWMRGREALCNEIADPELQG